MTSARTLAALALASQLFAPAFAAAQQSQSKSAPLASELAKLLDDNKLDSIAAKSADSYVGALYFPGQLLVVKAKYSVPARMDAMLTQKAFRDAYIDLNSASDPKTKVFVSDLGANGLRAKRENNQPFDTVDTAAGSTVFDGDWDKAKISEAEYMKRYQTEDDEYSQMLQALIAALKKPS